jgi:hypothetical protein
VRGGADAGGGGENRGEEERGLLEGDRGSEPRRGRSDILDTL